MTEDLNLRGKMVKCVNCYEIFEDFSAKCQTVPCPKCGYFNQVGMCSD